MDEKATFLTNYQTFTISKNLKRLQDSIDSELKEHESAKKATDSLVYNLIKIASREISPKYIECLSTISKLIQGLETSRDVTVAYTRKNCIQRTLESSLGPSNKFNEAVNERISASENVASTQRNINKLTGKSKNSSKAKELATKLEADTKILLEKEEVLHESMTNYEEARLIDTRDTLFAYVGAQIHFHAKSLEVYSVAASLLNELDIKSDIQNLSEKLKNFNTL